MDHSAEPAAVSERSLQNSASSSLSYIWSLCIFPPEGSFATKLETSMQCLEFVKQLHYISPYNTLCHTTIHLAVIQLSRACFNLSSRIKHFSSCLAFLFYDCPNAVTLCWYYCKNPENEPQFKSISGRWLFSMSQIHS